MCYFVSIAEIYYIVCYVHYFREHISQRRKPFCLRNDLKKAHQVWRLTYHRERKSKRREVCATVIIHKEKMFQEHKFEDIVAFSFFTISSENRNVKNNDINKPREKQSKVKWSEVKCSIKYDVCNTKIWMVAIAMRFCYGIHLIY